MTVYKKKSYLQQYAQSKAELLSYVQYYSTVLQICHIFVTSCDAEGRKQK